MSKTRICLVMPTLNQASYLAQAMDSIIGQNYHGLDYIVANGGSTDGSQALINERRHHLKEWISGKDLGQYHAINRAFAMSDAPIMGWLNGDDFHLPWTLALVGEIFSKLPEIRWLTTCYPLVVDEHGHARDCREVRGFSRGGILRGETFPGSEGFQLGGIQQEGTFWRRDLWDEAGGRLEAEFDYAADFDLWLRFAKHAEIYSVAVPLAAFRRHSSQKHP
jgi:GT2 family glycosyltransferase